MSDDHGVEMKLINGRLVQSNLRANVLLSVVVLVIVGCVMAVVLPEFKLTEYAQGIITFILGKYTGLFEQAFNFEFGGLTRASAKKDETIADLTKTAATTAATTAAVVGAPPVSASVATENLVVGANNTYVNGSKVEPQK